MNNIRLRFIPQAWQGSKRCSAVVVSPGGDRSLIWSVPVDVIDFDFHREHGRRDALRHEGDAPQWMRNWDGPFEIELEDYSDWDDYLATQEEQSFKVTKVLTPDQVKKELIGFYRDMLVNDPKNTFEIIECGSILQAVPSIPHLSKEEAAEKYAELCLGEKYCSDDAERPADLVLIQVGDHQFRFAAQKEQLHQGKAIDASTPIESS